MRILTTILCMSFVFSGELEVEGDLKVTGDIQLNTIESLEQEIAQLHATIAALQAQIYYLSNQGGYQTDCNGVVGGTEIFDINGECCEQSVVDACGYCDGDGVAEACNCTNTLGLNDDGCCDDVVMGCDDTCASALVDDDCGECNGTNTSCNVFGGGVTQFSAIFQSSNNNIRLNWHFLNGIISALNGILIVELIDEVWITFDSLSNPLINEYNTEGDLQDVGRTIGALPYDRYYNCYKSQFESNDECLEFLGFNTTMKNIPPIIYR